MNKVILLGNLTRDVELKHSQNGLAIGKTAIAVTRKAKNSQTGKFDKDEVMFVDLTIFGRTAEVVQQYFRKGSKILIEGRLSFDQWVSQNGEKRSKHSVIVENINFVESKGSNQQSGGFQPQQQSYSNQNYNNNNYNNNGYQQNSLPPQQAPQQQVPQQPQQEIPTIDVDDANVPF